MDYTVQIDELLKKIDEIALKFDTREYGLPLYFKRDVLRECVLQWMKDNGFIMFKYK